MSSLCGHWYPCLGLLVMSALGFNVRVDLVRTFFIAWVLFLRFTSGATPADSIEVSMAVFLIYLLADTSASIGGGSGLKPTTIHAALSKHGTVTTRPLWLRSWQQKFTCRCLQLFMSSEMGYMVHS